MPSEWTADRVLALAPDPASAKAGQGLGSAGKWATLGRGAGLIWGECQGSGKDPYQTKVDPDEPASSCSCPSRKFPCKHSIGLMLVWASKPGAFAEKEPPAWVVAWREKRAEKAEKAKEKQERGPAPVDLAARAKREAARASKVSSGLDDLSVWLNDLVRQGLSALGARSADLWDEQARRMVDAQAPGVARRLKQIDAMTLAGEGWHAALLDRLARLHLLGEGYRRLDRLPPEVAEDIRAAIGFPIDLDAVRSGPGVRDRWQVIGQSVGMEDRLTVARTWLVGAESRRPAMVLDFAAGNQPLDPTLPPGVAIDADLAFFPSSEPLRALVKERHAPPESLDALVGGTSIAEAFASHGAALSRNPWIEFTPVILDDVILIERDGDWSARDASGAVVPLSPRFAKGWHLLAIGGGAPMTLAGEFDGATMLPLSARAGGRFLPIAAIQSDGSTTGPTSMPVAVPILVEATASAVVGVDRKPMAVPPGDRTLSGLAEKEPAARSLGLAAASSLYGRAGRKPEVDPTPAPEPCPPDDFPECPPAAVARLRRMLGGENHEVIEEWVGLVAGSGRRMPEDVLSEMLELQRTRRMPTEPFQLALGVRGRWLASRNPRWQALGGDLGVLDPERAWEVGSRGARLGALASLRATDPGRARGLIAATFANEAPDDRMQFVKALARGLSMDDEPFLESALDDRAKNVRLQAAELLSRLPDSRLCARMIERARSILRWEGGLVVEPPTACDKAAVRDGVEPKPDRSLKIGDRAWWLRQVVAATPPKAVAAMLGVSPREIAASVEGGDWSVDLRWGLAVATIRLRDADWVEALLEAPSKADDPLRDPSQDQSLMALLPNDRRDAILVNRIRADPDFCRRSHPAYALLNSLDSPLGAEAAREILGRVRAILDEERDRVATASQRIVVGNMVRDGQFHKYEVHQMIRRIDAIVPHDLIGEAVDGFALGDPPYPYYAGAYAEMLDRLRFRHEMHEEFAR